MKKYRVGYPLDIVGVSLAAATRWQEVDAEDESGALKVAAINLTAKWSFSSLEHILSLKGTYEETKKGLDSWLFTDPIEVTPATFKYGDKVNFLGGTSYFLGQQSAEPIKETYIWAAIPTQVGSSICIIQHKDGSTKEQLMAVIQSNIPQILSTVKLRDGGKYMFVESEQLILIPKMENKKEEKAAVSEDVINIAKVCHQTSKAWLEANGRTDQKNWDDAEEWQRETTINGVIFHLANPTAGKEASHNAWMENKIKEGWGYGELKDAEKKTHPLIIPFEKLPAYQQKNDALFCAIVDALK